MADADERPWLRLSQIVEATGVPRSTLHAWLRDGRWNPRYRQTLGGHRRYHPDDVAALAERVSATRGGEPGGGSIDGGETRSPRSTGETSPTGSPRRRGDAEDR